MRTDSDVNGRNERAVRIMTAKWYSDMYEYDEEPIA